MALALFAMTVTGTAGLIASTGGSAAAASLPAPIGSYFVTQTSPNAVAEISASGTVVATTPLSHVPGAIVLGSDGVTAWVAEPSADLLSEVDLATNSVVASVSTDISSAQACEPTQLALGASGTVNSGEIFVLCQELGTSSGAVEEFSTATFSNASTASSRYMSLSDPVSMTLTTEGSQLIVTEATNPTATVVSLDPTSLSAGPTTVSQNLSGSSLPAFEQISALANVPTHRAQVYLGGVGGSANSFQVECVQLSLSGCPTGLPYTVSAQPTALAVAPDGGTLIVGDTTGSVSLANLQGSFTIAKTDQGIFSGQVSDLAVAPNGASVFVLSGETGQGAIVSLGTSNFGTVVVRAFGSNFQRAVAAPNVAPQANFSATLPQSPGGKVCFTANASDETTSPIQSYDWAFYSLSHVRSAGQDLGSARTSGPNECFTFSGENRGPYVAQLTVIDALGATAASTQPVGFVNNTGVPYGYVSDNGNGFVTAFSTLSNSVVGNIELFGDPGTYSSQSSLFPMGITSSPSGHHLYVAVSESGSPYQQGASSGVSGAIDVISTASNVVTKTIPLPDSSPVAIAVSPDGSTLYVADQEKDAIEIVDVATGAVLSTVSLSNGYLPTSLAVNAGGSVLAVNAVPSSGSGLSKVLRYALTNTVHATLESPSTSVDELRAYPGELVIVGGEVYVTGSTPSAAPTQKVVGINLESGAIQNDVLRSESFLVSGGIARSQGGNRLALIQGSDSGSRVWLGSVSTLSQSSVSRVVQDPFSAVAFEPVGSNVYTVEAGADSHSNLNVFGISPTGSTVATVRLSTGIGDFRSGEIDPVALTFPNVVLVSTPPPSVTTTTTTVPPTTTTSTTSTTATTVPLSPVATVPSKSPLTTSVTVPSVHTGKPWSASLWWYIMLCLGLSGIVMLSWRQWMVRRH